MPKFKSVIAGLVISTGMSGGLISLGALTTATSASATTASASTSASTFSWGCGRRCGGWGGWGGWGRRNHGRSGRVKVHIHLHNNNQNTVRTPIRSFDRPSDVALGCAQFDPKAQVYDARPIGESVNGRVAAPAPPPDRRGRAGRGGLRR